MTEIITPAFVSASLALVWVTILNDFPKLLRGILSWPFLFKKPLLCGFCFTYWITFLLLLCLENYEFIHAPFQFFLQWMSVGLVAVIMRFLVIILQELSHYLMHVLNNNREGVH